MAFRILPTLIIAVMVSFPAHVQSQGVGRVTGRILAKENGQPVGDATVELVGGRTVRSAALDGRFMITDVPVGTVSLRVRRLGFRMKVVSNIVVKSGGVTEQNIALETGAVELEAMRVTSEAERGGVARMLTEQRDASGVTSGISRDQIEKSPDVDAAAAVVRVSGVTVNNGRTVSVRGLAERYSTTTLNGARVPSPEPERRDVPLDLFPSGILDGIRASKTFTADRPGDFSGAEVDLRTRDFPTRQSFTLSGWVGANDAIAGRRTIVPDAVGGELFGVQSSARALPLALDTIKNLSAVPVANQPPLISTLRNVWSAPKGTGGGDGSLSGSLGGTTKLLGLETGYIATGTYTTQQGIHARELRNTPANAGGNRLVTNDSLGGQNTTRSMVAGGLFNVSVRVGGGVIRSANTFTRTADNEVQQRTGFTGAGGDDIARRNLLQTTRLVYTQRAVRSNQLSGEHRWRWLGVEWGGSNSAVERVEPDRSDFAQRVFVNGNDTTLGSWIGSVRSASRTFSRLTEDNTDLSGSLRFVFSSLPFSPTIKVGGATRNTTRNTKVNAYDFQNFGLAIGSLTLPAEQIFSPANVQAAKLRLQDNPYGGGYDAHEELWATFWQLQLQPRRSLDVIVGMRQEVDTIRVVTRGIGSLVTDRPTGFRTVDYLPTLSSTLRLPYDVQLRLGISKTLARPNYREMADLIYFEPIGGDIYAGNPKIRRSQITNYDLRAEWYGKANEALSVGVFYKNFTDPIEQALASIAGAAAIRWVNNKEGIAKGVEFEARTGLERLAPQLRTLGVFTNVSILQSSITLGDQLFTSPATNATRPMVGQAPYVVNLGLSWAPSYLSATLLYNRVGDRISFAGLGGLPDAKDKARNVLDMSMQIPLRQHVTVRFDGRNLLDAKFVQDQGGFARRSYTVGRQFRTGFSWTP
jgi:hypothetical protein